MKLTRRCCATRPKYFASTARNATGVISRSGAFKCVRNCANQSAKRPLAFGERADNRPSEQRTLERTCDHASMTALLLGRTMIGERVWDVSRAIDALEEFPEIDTSRIGCMGNSGGGTITFYATCLDGRISIAMPSCSICTLRDSIASVDHCADNSSEYLEVL